MSSFAPLGINQMSDDLFVYKFRAVNKRLVDSLVNPHLYFAKPSDLNDPFDCRLNLKAAFQKAMSVADSERTLFLKKHLDNQLFFDTWESTLTNVGVCSFSMHTDDALFETLLWAHYADEHRGVCLKYQFPKSFLLSAQFQLTAGGKIDYRADPLINLILNSPTDNEEQFVKDLALTYLKTKSPAWDYEKEVRLIRRVSGIFAIEGGFLKQVYFGLQTPKEDKLLVFRLANDYCGCIDFFEMVRDESDFGFISQPYHHPSAAQPIGQPGPRA